LKSAIPTIGLEVHVQLKTRSKMFCACPVEFGAAPNSHTCPTCLGLPGGLPVINSEAVSLTILTGLMLGCDIPKRSKFDRKNYFYPDMPKNYQISQYDQPLCRDGSVPLYEMAYPKEAQIRKETLEKKIPLVRIHLEEDVARSFHFENSTGIDFNRAGAPLMEIVTQPEIDSAEEAFAFLTSLKQILLYGRISDADMEKGQLRCDCNVSVRPPGQKELGAKIEIKNLNSISGVRRALLYEIERQQAALDRGETLQQETRGWDDDAGETFLMRTKEAAHDYRYFADPDLMSLETENLVRELSETLPESPDAKRERFVTSYGLTAYDAGVLASDAALADYFEKAAKGAKSAKTIANWVLNDLQSALGAGRILLSQVRVSPESLTKLVELIERGTISGTQAREVFSEMFASGKEAEAIVREKGMEQLSDESALEALCDRVIAENQKSVADFRSGNAASLNFLKGQVMKLSGGKANPKIIGEILQRKAGKES
jgi:aspartyl-tRNA(Asn)/glutamyl-tRNA(Gln) amidotransferase subunit B